MIDYALLDEIIILDIKADTAKFILPNDRCNEEQVQQIIDI